MIDRSGEQIDRYHLIRLLGQGHFGDVYLAEDAYGDLINAVAWSPDGTRIASGSWDKTVQVWQVG